MTIYAMLYMLINDYLSSDVGLPHKESSLCPIPKPPVQLAEQVWSWSWLAKVIHSTTTAYDRSLQKTQPRPSFLLPSF